MAPVRTRDFLRRIAEEMGREKDAEQHIDARCALLADFGIGVVGGTGDSDSLLRKACALEPRAYLRQK